MPFGLIGSRDGAPPKAPRAGKQFPKTFFLPPRLYTWLLDMRPLCGGSLLARKMAVSLPYTYTVLPQVNSTVQCREGARQGSRKAVDRRGCTTVTVTARDQETPNRVSCELGVGGAVNPYD